MRDSLWIAEGFDIPYHNHLLSIIDGLDSRLWEEGVFVGGTLCVFRFDEYRRSDDLDFFFRSQSGLQAFRSIGPRIFGFGECRDYRYLRLAEKLVCKLENPFSDEDLIKCEFLCSEDLLRCPSLFRTSPQKISTGKTIMAITPETSVLTKFMAFVSRAPFSGGAFQPNKDIVDLAVLYGKLGPEIFDREFENVEEVWGRSWVHNRLQSKLNESTLLRALDAHWLLPSQRRLAERAGRSFMQHAAQWFDASYRPIERSSLDIECEECETRLDHFEGKLTEGADATALGWLPFVASPPGTDIMQAFEQGL